jgi:acyl-CoA reductase-like NAD-dependent aldehyde dehydrogenase
MQGLTVGSRPAREEELYSFTTSGAVGNERLRYSAVLAKRSVRYGAATGHAVVFSTADLARSALRVLDLISIAGQLCLQIRQLCLQSS